MENNYESPICCEDYMELVNATSHLVIRFVFHCDKCGKIKICYDSDLDAFCETDVEGSK